MNDPRCVKLYDKFQMGHRGARISVQDIDVLIAERENKEALLRECSWLRVYPVLACPRTGVRINGFKEIDRELTLYHHYLDNYHASLLEDKLPVAKPGPGFGGGNQVTRPPTLVPGAYPPQPNAPSPPLGFPTAQPSMGFPTTQPVANTITRPTLPVNENKRNSDQEVSLPPANTELLPPTPMPPELLPPQRTPQSRIPMTKPPYIPQVAPQAAHIAPQAAPVSITEELDTV